MNNFKSIRSKVEETWNSFPDWNSLSEFVDEFHHIWLNLGNCVQQQLVQARIEEKERFYSTPRSKWERKGTIGAS